jgi:Mce-associated membrane protein
VSDDHTPTPDVEPTEGVEIDKPTDSDDDSTESETEAEADTSHDGDTSHEADPSPDATRPRLGAIPVIPLALVLGLLAAAGLAGWLYFAKYRPDTQVDAAVERSAVDAARDGTTALLSYKPDTLSHDFEAAKSHLSGDFRNYYDQFTKDVITPAAQSKGVTTTAQVVGAAATELHPNSAVVLVFVNQATTSKERPDPSMASSSVLVSLTKQNGAWLITKFDPV